MAENQLGQILDGGGDGDGDELRGLQGVEDLLRAELDLDDDQEDGTQEPEERELSDQEILDAELADEDGGDAGEGSDSVEWLAGLAEKAGIDESELYALKIPMGSNREAMTLGELKDGVNKLTDLESRETELTERKADFENEHIRARQELAEIVQLLPQLPPELVAKAKQQHIDHLDKERFALVSAIPEWGDPQTWRLAQDKMIDHVSQYGFTRMDFEQGTTDHRLIKLVWDFTNLAERFAKANERAKQVRESGRQRKNKQRRANAKQQQQARERSAANGSTSEQVAAINSILAEQK